MDLNEKAAKRVERYLLEELTDEESFFVEEEIFKSQEFYDLFCLIEEELIDEFLLDSSISPARKDKLYKLFHSTAEYQSKLKVTRALHETIQKTTQRIPVDKESVLSKIVGIFNDLLHIRYEVVNQ